jgi:hypothetical protein
VIRFDHSVCTDFEQTRNLEWLETNGLGGFSSSTITGLNTRRYHGLLTAATKPPVGRFVLLAKIEETLLIDGRRYDLSSKEGFQFTEGPIWFRDGGYLLFSNPNANTIYKYRPDPGNAPGDLTVFRSPSGYSDADVAEYGQPGSNGLRLDPQGRLTINEHGNHRVTRLEGNGSLAVLADRYQGKRLKSQRPCLSLRRGVFLHGPTFRPAEILR